VEKQKNIARCFFVSASPMKQNNFQKIKLQKFSEASAGN
jgi:hypothetical protein